MSNTEASLPSSRRGTPKILIVLLLLIAAAFTGYFVWKKSQGGRSGLPIVRVNIVTWPGYGPIYVAKEKGFFKEEGVEVDCQIQENTQARHAALAAGQIDLVGITLESVILASSQGVPMQVIGISDISNGGDGIVAKPEINSIADLKGKRVAYPEGQPSHLFLLYHLDKAGLKASDVSPVPTDDAGKAGELFAAGQVDAAVTWEPWLSKVTDGGRGKLLVSSKGAKDILIGILAANPNKLPESSDKLARFLRGWYRGLAFIQSNRAQALPVIAKGFNIPEADIDGMLTGLRFIGQDEAKRLLGAGQAKGEFDPIARYEEELWRKAGVIKKPVEPSTVYTGSVIEQLK